ncbi:PREDICTED: protein TRIGALACTOSYLDIACYLGLYCEROL 3, chloroplastic-like isoform X1 [Brassica oleracea var. oleracea]|uniref:Uncharacterized protein n=1 Tax=Brassica oleracea var. oleracea TaxID=109376 RepID=A0A0D3CGZ8_BRAOL|nr:PREDICTED: protein TRIGALACTOSYLDIACYLGLYCEROL 3, chloroplastic-like isoform X1 [Brassica oleracea var. oleracea]
MRMILLPSDKGEVYIRGKKRAGLTSDEEVSGLCIGLVLLPSSGHWNLEDGTNSVAMAKEVNRRMSICVLQLVRRSKHIYGKRQVKNVSVQSLLRTDVLLELFLFTTSADCRLFRGNALVSEMQGLIFGDVFLTVVVSSHLSCGQLPLLQRFQRS